MKPVWVIDMVTRNALHTFHRQQDDSILALTTKISCPEQTFLVRASGKTLVENFFDAISQLDDLMGCQIIQVAKILGIPLLDQDARKILEIENAVNKLAQKLQA